MPETSLSPAPTAVSPAAGAPLDAAVPTFVWDPVPGAGGYRLQVAASPGFAAPLLEVEAGPATELTLAVPLAPTTEPRFWRVGATGAGEGIAWSRPVPFSLPSRVELAAARESAAELKRVEGASTRQARALRRGLTVVPPRPTPPVLPSLPDGATLSGAPASTDWRRVPGVADRAPEAAAVGPVPRLLAPLAGAIVDGAAAVFAWRTVPGAVCFEVEVAPREDFSGPTLRVDAGHTAEVALSGLLPTAGDRLFWRARAVTEAGPGAWSRYGRFYAGTLDQAEAFRRRQDTERDFERRVAEHEALQAEAALDLVPLHQRPASVTTDEDLAYLALVGLFGAAILLGLLALGTMLAEAVLA